MTPKQLKQFNTANAKLKDVRTKKAAAQLDIDAAAQTVRDAELALKAAQAVFSKAQEEMADLNTYESLALKKTRGAIEAVVPGIVKVESPIESALSNMMNFSPYRRGW